MDKRPDSHVLVIFGASGDLTRRKLIPAIQDLHRQKFLCNKFAVLGVGRTEMSDEAFRESLMEGFAEFSDIDTKEAKDFLQFVHYQSLNTKEAGDYALLKQRLGDIQKTNDIDDKLIFYLATPPGMFDVIAKNLKTQGLHKESDGSFRRIIIEKPFGRDLASAKELNANLSAVFKEHQIYRIDHYLGK